MLRSPMIQLCRFATCFAFLVAGNTLNAEEAKKLVIFSAMGDVPYAPAEDILLPKQVAALPATAEFVIHVGDIKPGSGACTEDVYIKVAGMLAKSKPPVFIIPGDNEWNDCTDPAEAWPFWETYFMRFDERWKHKIPVRRQKKNRPENFAFTRNGVLFVGINLVGGRVHDKEEWAKRHQQNVRWVRRALKESGANVGSLVLFGHANPNEKHDDFFKPFITTAKEFKKPILYLHGDGHRWIHDRPFAAKNILRVQVDQGGIAPPLTVTVTNDPKEPFQFDRRKTEK